MSKVIFQSLYMVILFFFGVINSTYTQCNIERDTVYKMVLVHPDVLLSDSLKVNIQDRHDSLTRQLTSPLGNQIIFKIYYEEINKEISEIINNIGNSDKVKGAIYLYYEKRLADGLNLVDQQKLGDYISMKREISKADEIQMIFPSWFEGHAGLATSWNNKIPNYWNITSTVQTRLTIYDRDYSSILHTKLDSAVSSFFLSEAMIHESFHNLGSPHSYIEVIDSISNTIVATTMMHPRINYWTSIPYLSQLGVTLDSVTTRLGTYYSIKLYNDTDSLGAADIINNNIKTFFSLNPYTCNESTPVEELHEAENEVSIYPNPAVNFIRIDIAFQGQPFKIIDITGKKVANGIINSKNYIDNLLRGMYFLVIAGSAPIKFIKL